MKMKQLLTDLFRFNDNMNKGMLEKMIFLHDKEEYIRYFSHLINSQIRWLARIQEYPANPQLDWWLPVYEEKELASKWEQSLQEWIHFITTKTEDELLAEVDFIGFDGTHFVCPLKDIILQLNFHSIHHRAQMQMIIRQQGTEPDFIDYIGTKYRKVIYQE